MLFEPRCRQPRSHLAKSGPDFGLFGGAGDVVVLGVVFVGSQRVPSLQAAGGDDSRRVLQFRHFLEFVAFGTQPRANPSPLASSYAGLFARMYLGG